MRIFLTGASGFIGRHVLHDLIYRQHDVIAVKAGDEIKTDDDIIPVDINDSEMLKELLNEVDIVIHVAGLNSVSDSFARPDAHLRVNLQGTSTLLKACEGTSIKHFIYISSAEVYGNPSINPVAENHPVSPQSPYGVSKMSAELMCKVLGQSLNIPITVLRPFSIYGPNMADYSLIAEIIEASKQGTIVLNNLKPIRDYCYVSDLVDAISILINSSPQKFSVYNIGSGKGVSVEELGKTIIRLQGAHGKIVQRKTRFDRPGNSDVDVLVANCDAFLTKFNYAPQVTLEAGLLKTIEYFNAN